MAKVKRPLRRKILILLTLIPLLSFGIFVSFGSKFITEDKLAYVFDTASKNAHVLSNELYLSHEALQSSLRPIVKNAELGRRQFGVISQKRFLEQKNIEFLFLVREKGNQFQILDKLIHPRREIKKIDWKKLDHKKLFTGLLKKDFIYQDFGSKPALFTYSSKISEGEEPLYILGVVRLSNLYESFSTPGLFANYLIHSKKGILVTPKFWRKSQVDKKITDSAFFQDVFTNPSPQGVIDKKISTEKSLLVAYSETQLPNTYTLSVVDKSLVTSSQKRFFMRGLLIIAAAISLIVVVSVLFSHSISFSITRLLEITREIAQGNFNVEVKIKTDDEIEALAQNVRWMSKEVQSLMQAQLEQSRMESELDMVHLVQKNLFPKLSHRVGDYVIECRFASASEAGGDWFHYSVVGKHLIIWIGDATGHGAPAALITAAAKATSSVIELQSEDEILPPSEIMKLLNFAVNSTAKKSVMMTFFIASINMETGEMDYANASHEFPIVIPNSDNLKKSDFELLADVRGKRLGEKPDSVYDEAKYNLKKGESLFFYTDGITDLENEDGKTYGDGKLLRLLAKKAKPNVQADALAETLFEEFEKFRGKKHLVDDLMFIICRYSPEDQQKDVA